MLDAQGYFYPLVGPAREHGNPDCVLTEMEAQVERAKAMGVQPTHVDTHMGTVAHPKFMRGYLQTALKHGLPPMIFRMEAAGWMAAGLDAETAQMAMGMTRVLEESGMPLLDHLRTLHLHLPDQRLAYARETLSALQPGITHFIIHPSVDTPELREITPDWRARVADYQTFMSEELRETIRSLGIQVIGYRQLQSLMPDPAALAELPL